MLVVLLLALLLSSVLPSLSWLSGYCVTDATRLAVGLGLHQKAKPNEGCYWLAGYPITDSSLAQDAPPKDSTSSQALV